MFLPPQTFAILLSSLRSIYVVDSSRYGISLTPLLFLAPRARALHIFFSSSLQELDSLLLDYVSILVALGSLSYFGLFYGGHLPKLLMPIFPPSPPCPSDTLGPVGQARIFSFLESVSSVLPCSSWAY